MTETETLDRLYLEWAQFTKSRTWREVALIGALQKLRGYNACIAAGRINYRPEDHIDVIDRVIALVERGEQP